MYTVSVVAGDRPVRPLSPAAVAKLAQSGISPDRALAAGLYSVENAKRDVDGEFLPYPALVIPYFDRDGKPMTFDRDGVETSYLRVRYLHAEAGRSSAFPKYMSLRGSGVRAYLGPTPGRDWTAIAADADTPTVVCEGELKALKACQEGIPCVGLSGVDCFSAPGKSASGERELVPDIATMRLEGREVMICYDSDIAHKPRVQNAEERLARALTRKGAIVRRVRLPDRGGEKVGLDDFLTAADRDAGNALSQLCWGTEPWRPFEAPLAFDDLLATDFPPPTWAWQDFVLAGEVNLLYGDGGTGKSLLSLHIAAHVAAGRPLFDRPCRRMRVLALYSEDSAGEVKARLECILRAHGLPRQALPLRLWCQPREPLLANIDDRGNVIATFEALEAIRSELRVPGEPWLLILDGMADLFAVDETSRLPVTTALKRVLGSFARDYGATVLVLGHPSKAAMLDGSHYSGSTAFNNAVRQRLTLETVKDTQVGGQPPRKLSVAKSNYGADAEITLWIDGRVMVATPPGNTLSEAELENAVLKTMLRAIDRGDRIVNRNGNVGEARALTDFAKSVNEQHGLSMRWKEVADHLRRLVDKGVLAYRQADTSRRPHIKAAYVRGAGSPK